VNRQQFDSSSIGLRFPNAFRAFLVLLVISTVFAGFNVRPAFSQSSVVLSGNVLPFLSQAQKLTSPNAQFESQTRLTLAIGLAMPDRAGLDAYIEELYDRNSSNYHQWLTPVEIANEFGPSQADYDAVVAWLQDQGINVTQTFNHRLVIMASTTADVASRVFGVSFGTYNYNNQTFVAASNEPSVPAQFSGIVSSITGLDTYYGLVNDHAHRGTPVGQAGPNSLSAPYTPANIRTAYNLPVLNPSLGAGVVMGVLSACEASTTDLNGFASTYGLPSYTLNTNYFRVAVNSLGTGSDPPTDQEPTLDLEWSHALGPGANLYFYFDNGVSGCGSSAGWYFSGMIAAAAKALADNLVQTWSTSWGCSEDACWDLADRNSVDAEYASMAATGMTGFVATGDHGAYANLDMSTLDVQFPGSDPNIVAVGGTTLTINNDGSYGSESALWCPTCITDGWGGGGGNSVIFTKPSWQSGVTGVSKTGRGLPDVSLDMDFHYLIYYGGSLSGCCWGGTSFGAPEWNGIMATIIYATMQPTSRFGNINYKIYSATPQWTKRDVTTGANGYTSSCGGSGQPQCGYSAGPGWDYATGWGSLDGILAELTTNVASGSGSLSPSCPSGCSEGIGSSISVMASASANWQLYSWAISGASCSGGPMGNPCQFTMPSNAVTISAVFAAEITFGSALISWGSCANSPEPIGQTTYSPIGSVSACYVPTGYSIASWNCINGLSCSGSSNVISVSVNGPGTITLNLKSGTLSNPISTSLTAVPPGSTVEGTSFSVSGALTASGGGLGNEPIVCVFSWNTNIATATTNPTDGSYTCTGTAPTTPRSYNVDAFFLGDYTADSGTKQYLPSKATATITVVT
jgi:kumamolisin